MSRDTAIGRVGVALTSRVRSVRAHPLLHPVAVQELWRERAGHPVDESHTAHIAAGIDWLIMAQDATADGGIARGFSLVRDPYSGWLGWQPSYPETTGYIVPTLYRSATLYNRPDLAERATRAAAWEIDIQLPSGAVQGGVIGQPPSPAVFNTGQVLFGWLAAADVTGNTAFADAAHRAARFLVDALGPEGVWVHGRSRFARGGAELYNARTAWALAEAGARLGERAYSEAAAKALRTVAARQHDNGWFPDCCLGFADRPLLHTIAYTVRGLIEGGRVLADEQIMNAGARAASVLLGKVDQRGRMSARFRSDWSDAADYSCVTGQAQIVSSWLRLHCMTGDRTWLEPVPRVLAFLKSTQNRSALQPGLRGGIKGSSPISGAYGRYQVLSWATKFFVDALQRDDAVQQGLLTESAVEVLA